MKKNHKLVSKAWTMRSKEKSIENIEEYLNDKGFTRVIKRSGRKTRMTKQKLSIMFKDPLYYGLLRQADRQIDLTQLYDFVPATDEETYLKVQSLTYRKMKPSRPHKLNYYPFRMMIYCHYCGSSMRVAPSTGQSKRYLYARCDSKVCIRNSQKNKDLPRGHPDKIKASIRTKVVLDFIYDFLKGGLRLTEDDYNNYYSAMSKITDEKREELSIELHSRQGRVKQIKREINDNALSLGRLKPETVVWNALNKKIEELEVERKEIVKVIKRIKNKLKDPEKDKLSLEQFLNLSKNADVIVKSGNAKVKDTICRMIFANFFVDNEKVTKYSPKEPFATLLNGGNFSPSRGPGI